jgi:hypothetical protein
MRICLITYHLRVLRSIPGVHCAYFLSFASFHGCCWRSWSQCQSKSHQHECCARFNFWHAPGRLPRPRLTQSDNLWAGCSFHSGGRNAWSCSHLAVLPQMCGSCVEFCGSSFSSCSAYTWSQMMDFVNFPMWSNNDGGRDPAVSDFIWRLTIA